MDGYADGDNGNNYDDTFSKLTPVPTKFKTFESPPTPGVNIDIQPDPNTPWDDSLMCTNTPTKRASSIQVWCPVGPTSWL